MANITLYMSSKRREMMLLDALVAGFKGSGDSVEYCATSDYNGPRQWTDIACFVGVKSRERYEECRLGGKRTLLIDKSYMDRRESYRFSIDGFQPFYLPKMQETSDRLEQLGVIIRPLRTHHNSVKSTVLFAGSSQKFCDWHGLGDNNKYSVDACARINEALKGQHQLVYRPKPSWWANNKGAKIVPPNTKFSGVSEQFLHALQNCHCLVTYGSNAAVEALAHGVPVVLLSPKGVSPVYGLSEYKLENILKPFWPRDTARRQVLSNLAWCQFRVPEIESGFAWKNVKRFL